MRTLDAVFAAASATRSAKLRVQVKDAGGTWRDLTTYPGFDAVLGAEWGEDVDSHGMSALIRLSRGFSNRVLAPLVTASPLNRGFDAGAAYAALLAPGREVKVEWALVIVGGAPGAWTLGFHGYVDRVVPDIAEIVLEARGLEARLLAPYAVWRTEKIFSYAQGAYATKGCAPFESSKAVVLGTLHVPTVAKLNAHFYEVTTAGTTAAAEPAWNIGAGSTTSSGSAVFTERGAASATAGTAVETVMQTMLNDVLGVGVVTLTTPASPAWAVKWWQQRRVALWEGLRMLADQIGWDLRYRWDSGTSSFRLTLFAIDRAKTTADRTFAASELTDVQSLVTDITGVRNVVQVVYSDSADLDGEKRPLRKTVTATTGAGDLWMEIAEDSSSHIDTASEATTLATAVRDDLSTPQALWGVDVLFFPWVELADLYEFLPGTIASGAILFDSATKLAVVGYRHRVTEGQARTSVSVRGKPSSGYNRWLGRDSSTVRREELHDLTVMGAGGTRTLSTAETVGGTKILLTQDGVAKRANEWRNEIHVSAAASFTPSNSTLVGEGYETTLANLVPGKTYYVKTIEYGYNARRKVRSLPSAESSFVAGRAKAGHLNSDVEFGRLPLNGGFETLVEAAAAGPPDHWEVTDGGWSDALEVISDGTGVSGANWLRINAKTTQIGIRSDYFDVEGGRKYELRAWGRGISGVGMGLDLKIEWFTAAKASESTSPTLVTFDSSTTTWAEKWATVTAPASARFGRAKLIKTVATADGSWGVDAVSVGPLGDNWQPVTFLNSWLDYNVSTHEATAYRYEGAGLVRIRGTVRSGTVGSSTPIFTLPNTGYRPTKTHAFAVTTSTGLGHLEFTTDGGVALVSGGNAWAYIECSFALW